VFGRLDEEIDAITAADLSFTIVPGITAASAGVAQINQSLTKRGRNSSVRFITGHDTKGYADHDWRALAADGQVAAIYMGKKSARFIQGRLLMHGADPLTHVTVIENVSRADKRVIATTLGELEPTISNANLTGPALTFLGLAPRAAVTSAQTLDLQQKAL
jgi:uroporphyrin-III C-methyltransferase/precorrin-2 dehydrogenase/sirohydrochlorin ferrochelatase